MAAENTLEEAGKRRRRKPAEETVNAEEAGDRGGKGQITPGRRNQEDEPEVPGNAVTRPFYRLWYYLQDVQAELKKVIWPTRPEAVRLTRIVLIALIISAIVMGIIGFLMNQFVTLGLNVPVILLVTFIIITGVAIYAFRRDGGGRRGY
ncbi:MAG: preprotein translocase subunit SecE [Anaerolineae bacterium]|jgi:preprotein translocase subunit SecE|nr:preprotein translocase subunit SecE [Anaerolineae bacterium]